MAGEDVFDVTIIGAGPTGLFAAFYAGLREMRTKIIEALPEPGGQLAVLYPEKFIYDVPGHPKILAKDLVKLLIEQCALFEPVYVYEQRIETLTRATVDGEEVWRLGTDGRDAPLAHGRHHGRHRRVRAEEARQARRGGVRGPRRVLLREGQAAVPRQAHPDRRRRRHGDRLVPQPQGLGEGASR